MKSKSTLYFFVVEASGATARFSSRNGNLMRLLKASCTLPVEEAINDGCTYILVLLTQPINLRDSIGSFENLILKVAMPRLSKFVDAWINGYMDCFDLAIGRINKKNVNIVAIVPDSGFMLKRLTKSEELLKEAAIDGAKKVYQLFSKPYDTGAILRYN